MDSGDRLLRRVKSSHLLLLLALSEHGSLRRAAEVTGTTQPAATRLLRDLEAAIGQTLFERHPKGLRPTGFGRVMIRHARAVRAELDHTVGEIMALSSGYSGTLRIGCIPSAVPFLVARTVVRLKRQHPRLRVLIDVATSNHLMDALAEGSLDLALGRVLDATDEPGLALHGTVDEELVVCCRKDHPLRTESARISWVELSRWPWVVLPAGSPMRHILSSAFRGGGAHEPDDLTETASFLMAISLLAQSDAVSLLPRDVLLSTFGRPTIEALAVDHYPRMGPYSILTRRDRETDAAVQLFIAGLKETAVERGGVGTV
ncbi:LysR family transcriptional regulator [Aureimonas frigidaquae]|uniref:Transcriptional regulator, LysR family n=1 Tax=Aureimonas frigidaquae TaxID=424757 RepID=A0A0P0Z1C4_9HYPH|nr:LysR family transcriptional regulator [Aureimonas frigidaquae]BAT27694.1 transcriptional regulator, LysR family precursor [Aureimonas frigidaquae]